MEKLKTTVIIQIVLIYLIGSDILYSQNQNWISEEAIYSTVLLERKDSNEIIPHGTGFLIHNYNSEFNDFLVTCAHLLKRGEIYITIPPSTKSKKFLENMKKKSFTFDNDTWIFNNGILRVVKKLKKFETYVSNDSLDIAIIPISIPAYKLESVTVSSSNRKGCPKSVIGGKQNITLGKEIFFIGFPLMIGTPIGYLGEGKFSSKISNPLVRTGTIAWVSSDDGEFLLDAFSYGGNSGSPVFLKPSTEGSVPYLIGMINGHLNDPYSNSNMGLAKCISIDKIMEVIKKYYKY
jgi:hypothetical protein